ncbi:short subunit dehydrogenase [Planomicrobium soli]|uniref:Short subunit dehydrogenase n=1 Tax=Planomicrobium soli TaxID=1176648 RepID=A0A2P8H2A3_9BACL|nr:short subunit dehydrogenase [Planomicrobium soli]
MGRNFAGRTAFVTGGSRGIGRKITERLASKGANVAVNRFDKSVLKVDLTFSL